MAEASAEHPRIDNSGGGGEVPPLLDESGWYFSDVVKAALRNYDEDMLQRITDEYTVDAQNKRSMTLLMQAAWCSNIMSVRFLVERGAAVNIQNEFKVTALHRACSRYSGLSEKAMEEVIVLLLHTGADPTLKDKNNRTPRDWLL